MISVLYVDDETDLLYVCKKFLEEDPEIKVDISISAVGAMEILLRNQYDVIISDYQMPGKNAIDFLKDVRSTVGEIPFILFTGRGREDVVIEALNNGADFYLQKGYDMKSQFAELSHMIHRAVERRKSKSALQESISRLYHAEEIALIGHWEVHLDSLTVKGSQGAQKIYDLQKEEWQLCEVQEMVLPEFRLHLDNALKTLVSDGNPYDVEFKVKRKGDGIIIDIHSVAEYDPATRRVFGIIQDITRSKKAEEALLHSKGHLRTLLQAIPDLIWLKDINGVYLSCNTMFEKFFGAPESEILGKTDFDFLAPELVDFFREHDRIAMEAGKPVSNEEWITFADDGHCAMLETIKTPMYDSKGNITGVLGIGRDITDRKRAEQTIREKSAFLENLISIANVPIIVWDPSFRITRINHAFEELIGRSEEEIIGHYLQILFPPDKAERTIRLFQATLNGIRWEPAEIDIIHRDGSLRTLLWNSSTLFTENGKNPVATIAQGYDITGERQLKQEKEDALIQIQQNLAYLAVLNDEIRNPLTVITSFADMQADTILREQIIGQVRRIDSMVNQLDRRWIESEKVLHAIRKHYQVHSILDSESDDPSSCSVIHGKEDTGLIEDSSRTSESRYRQLIEFANDGIFVTQFNRLQLVNPRMTVLTGYEENELFSLTFLTFIYPDDRVLVEEQYQKCLLGEDVSAKYSFRLLRKDRTTIWVEMSVALITWEGNPALLNFLTDISDRKKVEEAFRESEERYRLLAENAPIGILTCDKEGNISYINPKLLELFGAENQKEMKEKNLFTFPPLLESGLSQTVIKTLDTGTPVSSIEFAYTSREGKRVYYLGHVSPLTHKGQVYGAQIILGDITKRKLDEEALRESNKKLRLLTSLTRHDIFNQLSTVGLLQDLASHTSDLEKVREYISLARKAEEQIEETIGFTREYENFGIVSSNWLRLHPIIESAKGEVSLGSLRIENFIPESLEVYTDPIIRKVFTTLLENAVRHGGTISIIRFTCLQDVQSLSIVCEDDGFGVSPEEKVLIFDHGYGRNTGVGLFLAREILCISGLSIRETGNPGTGARFEIVVPAGKFRMS